jgi:hypothetical protein
MAHSKNVVHLLQYPKYTGIIVRIIFAHVSQTLHSLHNRALRLAMTYPLLILESWFQR